MIFEIVFGHQNNIRSPLMLILIILITILILIILITILVTIITIIIIIIILTRRFTGFKAVRVWTRQFGV